MIIKHPKILITVILLIFDFLQYFVLIKKKKKTIIKGSITNTTMLYKHYNFSDCSNENDNKNHIMMQKLKITMVQK